MRRILNGLDISVRIGARTGLSESFIRFGIVGTLGFCWDTLTVYALKNVAGLYIAGTAGFLVAASANWMLNRFWTFRYQNHIAAHIQWAKFMAANSVGFIFNRGTFFELIAISPICRSHPVFAIVAGSAAGILFNYFLSKRLVFS